MKKLFYILLFFIPLSVSADNIGVYLSMDKKVYHPEVWTTDIEESQRKLTIEYMYAREDLPLSYLSTDSQILARISSILSNLTTEEQDERLRVLLEKNTDNFLQYLSVALSPDIDQDINTKKDQ